MTRIETLKQLQARLRESKDDDRELDAHIYGWTQDLPPLLFRVAHNYADQWLFGDAIKGEGRTCVTHSSIPHYTASLDACVALLNAALPGCMWARELEGRIRVAGFEAWPHVIWAFPLATDCHTFLDAIVSAVIAEEETKENAA